MNLSSWSRAVMAAGVLVAGLSCSAVKPAGSLGYLVDGDTRFRPVPKNYRHVPPRVEQPVPQFKLTF